MIETTDSKAAPRVALFELKDIHKTYGNTRAVRGVSLCMWAGEVHALVGENGCGKSTLMKVAYGEVQPTSGTSQVCGREVAFRSPSAAQQVGIVAVPQDVPLVAGLNVGENIMLGRLARRGGLISWPIVQRQASSALRRIGSDLDPAAPVAGLGPEERQIVAIAHAIAMGARIIILDEPTSSLSADQTQRLFAAIRQFKAEGRAVMFISQRLQDVSEIADFVTVMRNGRIVGELEAADATHDKIIDLMIGRPLDDYFHKQQVTLGKTVLRTQGLTKKGRFRDVSIDVRAGEIVGITGLVGCGREELLRAIYGATKLDSGELEVNERRYTPKRPTFAVSRGVGFVTGDRKGEGLVLGSSVGENVTLIRNRRLSLRPVGGRMDRGRAQAAINELQVRPPRLDVPVGKLSGGNQQKVALAKWLVVDADVLLLEEPTRGIDVGTKSEIYRLMRSWASDGVGIMVSSADLPELVGICDRVIVMFGGEIVGDLSGEELTEREVGSRVVGG